MQENRMSKNERVNRFGLFMLFVLCGLLVFFINMTYTYKIPLKVGIILKMGLVIIFFISALWLYHNKRLNKYWKVCYAFFVASISVFISLHLSKFMLGIFDLEISTLNGFTTYKFLEDLIIVVFIIVLVRIAGGDMASIYLKKGNLKLGLIIGITSFLVLSSLSVLQFTAQQISFERFFALIPPILIIVLADGFMEELLFRGLFLKKLASFLGDRLSNVLTALVFTLTHLQVTYTSELPMFLIVLFLLGLLWGYIIQQTDSLWGAVLFHAGTDTLIIIQFLSSYGVIS